MSSNETNTTAATAVDYDPFAEPALARVVPTTAPQREIWLAAKLEPEASLAYNESVSLRFYGELDLAALQRALQQLIDRHESLRARLSANGEELHIAAEQRLSCPVHELASLGEDERRAEVAAALHRVVVTPFDLEHGPLVRAELLHLAAQTHLLVFTVHHIVCDGWSFGVIVRDLAALYAQQTGQGDGPPTAESFTDFALGEATRIGTDAGREDEQYWLACFASPPPSLDLPTDRPRQRRRTFTSQREDRTLDAALVADIKRMGAKRGASLYAVLLAGFGVLLQRLSGQDDVVVGIPSAGQAAGGHDGLVGHCVNVLPLRVTIDPQASFGAVLEQVRGDLLDGFEHQQYTLGSLLARLALPRDPGRLPLVSVLFNLDQALDEQTVSFPGLRFDFAANPRAFENFELFINAVQTAGGLRLECQYNSDLFRGETVRCWLDAYETLLRHAAAEPETLTQAFSLLSPSARRKLESLQPQPTPYPVQQLAHEYFEIQVDRAPARTAVRHRTAALDYAGLEARANRLAHCLRKRGVGRGALVGLMVARSTDMLVTLLAVLKSGAGYVPMDPGFPADRLGFMAEDAALAALIVDDAAPAAFAFPPEGVLSLARCADEIAASPATRPARDERAATPDSVAYVIFTSGSTGRPKGVRVPHRATSNFLTAMQRVPGIAEDDRLVAVTTLSFDIAFMEMLLPLSVGAEIVLADHDDVREGAALRKLVETSKATMMQATPAGWRILIDSGWAGHAGFRAVSGGEPLPVDLAEALLQRCGEVWNGYGPTETTVYSTYWPVTNPREGIFIGRPVANTTVYILDGLGLPCPLGVPGEIHIGGAGVALGYLNRPELDAERFLPDHFAATAPAGTAPARMYRTGDRGRWLANGMLEHLGRLDFQVKVRGYRIELGEIETVLTDLDEVARAVVIAREDRPGDVRLVAYVVARKGATLEEETLRDRLRQRLPEYMLPQHLMQLDAIPQLPNGKIDRKALPAPQVQSVAATTTRQAPHSDDERRVAAAMEAVLALPDLDVRDDFFALGGHSLLAAQLTARLNREFGITLSLRTLFDAPTIAQLAAAIRKQVDAGTAPAARPILRRAAQDRAPLSLMQKRLWALEELQPGRVTYNAPSAHRLRGRLDEGAFERALQALIQRQPSMRTSFRRNGEDLEQVVEAQLEVKLFPAEDLTALPAAERETVLMQRLQELTDTAFDLTRAPLFSARMFRLGEDDHAFFFMPHHIIWDGWSFDILYAELSQLYRAFSRGEPVTAGTAAGELRRLRRLAYAMARWAATPEPACVLARAAGADDRHPGVAHRPPAEAGHVGRRRDRMDPPRQGGHRRAACGGTPCRRHAQHDLAGAVLRVVVRRGGSARPGRRHPGAWAQPDRSRIGHGLFQQPAAAAHDGRPDAFVRRFRAPGEAGFNRKLRASGCAARVSPARVEGRPQHRRGALPGAVFLPGCTPAHRRLGRPAARADPAVPERRHRRPGAMVPREQQGDGRRRHLQRRHPGGRHRPSVARALSDHAGARQRRSAPIDCGAAGTGRRQHAPCQQAGPGCCTTGDGSWRGHDGVRSVPAADAGRATARQVVVGVAGRSANTHQ